MPSGRRSSRRSSAGTEPPRFAAFCQSRTRDFARRRPPASLRLKAEATQPVPDTASNTRADTCGDRRVALGGGPGSIPSTPPGHTARGRAGTRCRRRASRWRFRRSCAQSGPPRGSRAGRPAGMPLRKVCPHRMSSMSAVWAFEANRPSRIARSSPARPFAVTRFERPASNARSSSTPRTRSTPVDASIRAAARIRLARPTPTKSSSTLVARLPLTTIIRRARSDTGSVWPIDAWCSASVSRAACTLNGVPSAALGKTLRTGSRCPGSRPLFFERPVDTGEDRDLDGAGGVEPAVAVEGPRRCRSGSRRRDTARVTRERRHRTRRSVSRR